MASLYFVIFLLFFCTIGIIVAIILCRRLRSRHHFGAFSGSRVNILAAEHRASLTDSNPDEDQYFER